MACILKNWSSAKELGGPLYRIPSVGGLLVNKLSSWTGSQMDTFLSLGFH